MKTEKILSVSAAEGLQLLKSFYCQMDKALIINGDSLDPEPRAVGTVVPPKTKAQKLAKKNELKAKTIKIRFGGNKESKKMHKTILKQRYENFVASRSEGLDKTYDSMDDLYNNLKLYEAEIKRKSSSSSNSYNVAFVSSKNTSSINETVNAAHDISAAGLKEQPSTSSYVDDVAMITMRVKKFIKIIRRNLNFNGKEPVGFDKTKVECYNCHRRGHFAKECRVSRNQGNMSVDNERRVVPIETPASALVVQDGLVGYDWSYQAEKGPTDFALMARSSDLANSSNSKVQSCLNECLQSFKKFQKQYDQQKEILNRANLEILGYQYGLESLEERIRVHQKNETVFEESIAFLKYDVQVRDILIKDLKNQLKETMKEKDDLKEKLTNQLSENEMPKCEIFEIASDSSVSEIDEDNNQSKDMYKVGIGYHAVPPPYTGNYMPSRVDISFAGLDDSVFKFKISETRTSVNENESTASKSSKEIREEPKTVSVNHLTKDCTFYENKMVEKSMVNNKGKGTGQREVRPVWNNARKVNHQNFSKMTHPHPKRNFVPTTVATKSRQVLVNAAKLSSIN
nr:hypothetical protein [Tanacetum cinerariifolium]